MSARQSPVGIQRTIRRRHQQRPQCCQQQCTHSSSGATSVGSVGASSPPSAPPPPPAADRRRLLRPAPSPKRGSATWRSRCFRLPPAEGQRWQQTHACLLSDSAWKGRVSQSGSGAPNS